MSLVDHKDVMLYSPFCFKHKKLIASNLMFTFASKMVFSELNLLQPALAHICISINNGLGIRYWGSSKWSHNIVSRSFQFKYQFIFCLVLKAFCFLCILFQCCHPKRTLMLCICSFISLFHTTLAQQDQWYAMNRK